ncbi:RNA helicase [Mesobacillus harenae]|uniref:RNA helicase n=1 Tax=Mesobacillus harenae TaxID=2213203 RepID=UPI0015804A00|nr:RNA helicase [Mesobacillus harenae]
MNKLTYFIDTGKGDFEPFYEYKIPEVGADEIYARQLCTYFIMKGIQYELVSNEMSEDEEILVLKQVGNSESSVDEQFYRGKGLHLEFRRYSERERYRLLTSRPVETHFDIIRYLIKDVVDVPELGQMEVTSTEIDEDRAVYVIYVKNIGERG